MTKFCVRDGELVLHVQSPGQPSAVPCKLVDAKAFVGFLVADASTWRNGDEISSALLVHHQLHVRIQVDRRHRIGSTHRAGIFDVILESAATTIMDMEDSVAAVDAQCVLSHLVFLPRK